MCAVSVQKARNQCLPAAQSLSFSFFTSTVVGLELCFTSLLVPLFPFSTASSLVVFLRWFPLCSVLLSIYLPTQAYSAPVSLRLGLACECSLLQTSLRKTTSNLAVVCVDTVDLLLTSIIVWLKTENSAPGSRMAQFGLLSRLYKLEGQSKVGL